MTGFNVSNPADELKELLDVLDGPYGWKADLEAHIRRVTLEAQRERLRVVLELTRHSYDTRSPFANIENINNEVIVVTNSCIITQIEAITKELQEIEGEQ